MKNYSAEICNLEKRQLSAKGIKFLHNIERIALNKKGLNFYAPESKPIKQKIKTLIEYLIFDQLKTIDEVKEIIKNRIEKNTLN